MVKQLYLIHWLDTTDATTPSQSGPGSDGY